MRVALVSDLHGNALALEAVLDDAARAGVDRVVCLGDTATLGPRPREVLARLDALGCDCVMGNHDAFLLDAELIKRYTEAPPVVAAVDWCRAQLSRDELDFVRTFRASVTVPLDDGATLYCYHGTPRSNMEDLVATTPPDVVDEMIAGVRATVLAGGHTHLQMLRQHRGMLIVNPGSVGQPFVETPRGTAPTLMPHAEYAVVSATDVQLKRVPLDRRALREQAAACDFPLRDFLLAQYA